MNFNNDFSGGGGRSRFRKNIRHHKKGEKKERTKNGRIRRLLIWCMLTKYIDISTTKNDTEKIHNEHWKN